MLAITMPNGWVCNVEPLLDSDELSNGLLFYDDPTHTQPLALVNPTLSELKLSDSWLCNVGPTLLVQCAQRKDCLSCNTET